MRKLFNKNAWRSVEGAWLIVIYLTPFHSVYSQVINDDIDNRINLELNEPFNSNTVNCSVQWDCVDESLTGRCIKYHNDQWFSFDSPPSGNHYLNISNQRCRDLYGVQIVVLKGTPCDTKSYEIFKCHSTGNRDDIFLDLSGLEPSQTYLVNIDGYLHDFCSFNIELSEVARGLPVEKEFDTHVKTTYKPDSIILSWRISKPISMAVDSFEIWRREPLEARHSLSRTIRIDRNTLGSAPLEYNFKDARSRGRQISYKIVGVSSDKKILVDELLVRDDSIVVDNSENNLINFKLDFKNGTPLTILIFNNENNALLQNSQLIFEQREHEQMSFYIGHLKDTGIRYYRVEITNNKDRTKRVLTFSK
jgi:hypothetical protein